jgi:hypothetical protein
MTPPERTGVHVELYARETLPSSVRGRRNHVRTRLASLSSDGAIASFDVTTWPKRIPREGANPAARDCYVSFEAWAADRDVRLTPFFDTRTCYSKATGDCGDWVIFPALCLTVSENDSLRAVYPHMDGDTDRSVQSGLDALTEQDTGRADRPERNAAN